MTRTTIITGATGGMGRACARMEGGVGDLILTDVSRKPLALFTEELRNEGAVVRSNCAGDLADAQVLEEMISHLDGGSVNLVHTAGLSPAQGDWKEIVRVNLVATERLLSALDPHMNDGSVAVLIASSAAHAVPVVREMTALLDRPCRVDLFDRLEPVIMGMASSTGAPPSGIAYAFSKQAVVRICRKRAMDWGRRGARIVSLSPGVIMTPMGRRELAENGGAADSLASTPMGRAGSVMDIAHAVRFLTSEAARFITGSDLLVDGGVVGAQRAQAEAE